MTISYSDPDLDPAAYTGAIAAGKPPLKILGGDQPQAARALMAVFRAAGGYYQRGGRLCVVITDDEGPRIEALTPHAIVSHAHDHVQPQTYTQSWGFRDDTLPRDVADLLLARSDEWRMPILTGFTTAPVLREDGSLHIGEGYDVESRLWCVKPPVLRIKDHPTETDAREAMRHIRAVFSGFPFADSTREIGADGTDRVNLATDPGMDESAFLTGLLTAVARPSLHLAPAMMVTAPDVSGAGTGKGNLVRAASLIAFGIDAGAMTAGHDQQELDKRITAEVLAGRSVLFIDNCNGQSIKSDTLASVLTENPAVFRVMGSSKAPLLNHSAFVAVTGNGVAPSEDLIRRFMLVRLDAKMENPESRRFKAGFLAGVKRDRPALLSQALTIWRWGRQHPSLRAGLPLGSYETWTTWVRDPLLALGCADPVARMEEMKAADPRRMKSRDLLETWYQAHGSRPVPVSGLNSDVLAIINPLGKTRQFVAAAVQRMVGARVGGFVLVMQAPAGAWGAATYAVQRVG